MEIFVALAEEEHFGSAARRVGITQPPLSQGLRRLEALLGVRLFDRGRGVALTDEGARLLPHARTALAAIGELRERGARERAEGPSIRLGVAPEVPSRLVAALAAAPARAGLRGRIGVVTAPTASLLAQVAAGRLDLAVIRHPAVLGGLAAGRVALLPTWRLAPAAGPGGPRRLPVAVRPRSEAPAAHDLFVDALASRGRRVETVVVPDERAALALVAAGQATLVTADGSLAAEGVERTAATDPPLPLRLRVVWDPRIPAAEETGRTARALTGALLAGAPARTAGDAP
ncbi:LysR family transcriptional regulator [Streptomyces sp. NPDC047002]|uniref:LysR family transcriptional regulator n=1 Tax=Streptomyces sp. NPDC047002 TaxID=3155475 RepID=UPI0034570E12